ncbi:isochorismate synthase [Pelodictyon luteolum]|uniref:Isochorismate synthase MenF n=1 Tax=Chlorobium luteolum (strain DSM 273 / BCRC 81028 / 2530) TaxID=319225 RepID=Q3B611_CHLL3|nr:isochorismate synthase [Pelodictyon luteolum]ABB23220.1 Isochorismate synthase [Pelodictyon luteolum DSM 273]
MSDHHIIITPTETPLPIAQAAEAIQTALQQHGRDGANPLHPPGTLMLFRQPLQPSDPAKWLAAQNIRPRIFWRNREQDYAAAGIGVADRITYSGREQNSSAFRILGESMAQKSRAARYFGGISFNNIEQQDHDWKNFPAFSFILPLLELSMENGACTLTCHILAGTPDETLARIEDARTLIASLPSDAGDNGERLPAVTGRSCSPDREGWIRNCGKAIATFEDGSTEKIMLARKTTLEFASACNPMLFLLRHPYPQNSTYRFYFEPEEGCAFLSFTPERLYRRDGSRLLTEALAGTCSKEGADLTDEHASRALLGSEKDIREHRFVKDMIYNELLPACSQIEMEDEVQVLQLNRLAHLYTRCSAVLKPECTDDGEVLSILHPTPAVGGVPKEEAMRHIMELEPFSRGWYAAPVGWIMRDAAEFAVGIRSALVNGTTASLYSGAGLVRGSDPELEWDEVEQKIGDLLAITEDKA